MKFILASSSPRRKVLFHRLQIPFEIDPPIVDESKIELDANPEEYCTTLAEMKATNICQNHPSDLVIGADTIVFIDNIIMGKPDDREQALHMLKTLSGKTHQVYTGVCLKSMKNNIHHTFAEITWVTFTMARNK